MTLKLFAVPFLVSVAVLVGACADTSEPEAEVDAGMEETAERELEEGEAEAE